MVSLKVRFVVIFLFILIFIFSGILFFFWQKLKNSKLEIYYYFGPPQRTFLFADQKVNFAFNEHIREATEKKMKELIQNKESFIFVDLKNMELHLYKEGEKFRTFKVQSKGAEWFWGETPPGVYSVGIKSQLHFSSPAKVWMPYAVQFFGNYFIHGWPYTPGGRLLPPGPSGGCIRLKTEDAKIVFEFAQPGMPILIFDEKETFVLPAIALNQENLKIPEIKAQSVLVADLDTGEIILEKEANSEILPGSLTYVMLSLAATEAVNLDRKIVAKKWMIEGIEEKIIVPGKIYSGQELLQILLSKSSKEAAFVLIRFLSPEKFINLMNEKAKAIGMENTFFYEISDKSQENSTTLLDVAKMMHYIKSYRKFILKINSHFKTLGQNETASIFSVKEMKLQGDDTKRFIFIGLVNSPDVELDYQEIIKWLKENFSLS